MTSKNSTSAAAECPLDSAVLRQVIRFRSGVVVLTTAYGGERRRSARCHVWSAAVLLNFLKLIEH
jgi:hypothetical protein